MMSKKIKYINFFSIIILILIVSCSKNDKLIKKSEKILPLNILYKKAFDLYQNAQYFESIDMFKKVETNYSFSEWAPKATLMIMYINFEGSQYIESLEYAQKFKKLYPKNKNIDYVDFISALIFYEQIDVVSRDQTYAIEAKKRFINIINNYPKSIYAEESKYKIDLINEQLAGKEMYIARFYMKKSKWIPAINRLKKILNNYETTVYSTEALHRLVEVYYKLGNLQESKKYAAILGYNFNDSLWYKKSYKIVADKNYKIEVKKQKRKLRDRIKKLFKFSK
ncbi:MAG: outer membrane protein assembly factor BamD [Pelagibacteraceae bacterium]|nr:outer membrane protein assembly factor BamD [Pelagibacteraceae bacterium]MCI5079490.1 outer membrane protein assembly factor BamD [Pelagibacteraceae bacterium]